MTGHAIDLCDSDEFHLPSNIGYIPFIYKSGSSYVYNNDSRAKLGGELVSPP